MANGRKRRTHAMGMRGGLFGQGGVVTQRMDEMARIDAAMGDPYPLRKRQFQKTEAISRQKVKAQKNGSGAAKKLLNSVPKYNPVAKKVYEMTGRDFNKRISWEKKQMNQIKKVLKSIF